MFLPLAWIATTIAATRMYRSLVEYANKSTDMYESSTAFCSPPHCGQCDFRADENPKNVGLPVLPQRKQINGASIPMGRIEFALQIVSVQHGTPRAIRDDGSCISTNVEQMHRKPKRLGQHDDDVACSV